MTALPTLQRGSLGQAVKNVQAMLNTHGATLAVDGDFGPLTAAAVSRFQGLGHLIADSVVGPHTWSMLLLGKDVA